MPIELWPSGAKGASNRPESTLSYFEPKGPPTGGAVIVCPGGGYTGLADHEGIPVAERLNEDGIAAFVLRYRLAPNRHPAMHQDAARAIRTVRCHAAEYGIDPGRIGILGFSAGGHLAGSAATIHDEGDARSADPVERVSSRPDLAVLVYPVISLLPPYYHGGSAVALLGEDPDPALPRYLSLQNRVDASTPPIFLVHSADDGPVPVKNSLLMADSLTTHRIPFELHLFEHGGHGFGLAQDDPALRLWPDLCIHWLKRHGFADR